MFDDLNSLPPHIADQIIRDLEGQIASARSLEAQKLRKLRLKLDEMPPEQMVERLKSVLYRVIPMIGVLQDRKESLTTGEAVAESASQLLISSLVDVIYWISQEYGLEYNKVFGDDSFYIRVKDLRLGESLVGEEMAPPSEGLDFSMTFEDEESEESGLLSDE